jgi:hypothetical protein
MAAVAAVGDNAGEFGADLCLDLRDDGFPGPRARQLNANPCGEPKRCRSRAPIQSANSPSTVNKFVLGFGNRLFEIGVVYRLVHLRPVPSVRVTWSRICTA